MPIRHRSSRHRRPTNRVVLALVAVVVILAVGAVLFMRTTSGVQDPTVASIASGEPVPTVPAERVAALPEARYDAAIPGLMAYTRMVRAGTPVDTYQLTGDAALFGADRRTPVARLAARNFLGKRTPVVAVGQSGPWTMILTPARQQLPSSAVPGGPAAAAQTAAWLPTSTLTRHRTVREHVTVHVGDGTLTISRPGRDPRTVPAAVGAAGTPTPVHVTGYLQARYLDPAQGQPDHPIQLSSLHATAADEPYAGADGGLIGIHAAAATTGTITHGCIRVTPDTITALNTLPLGTLISITA